MHHESNLARGPQPKPLNHGQNQTEKPPRHGKKLTVFLIILCIILLAAAITFAALYFFKPKTKTVVETKTAETSQTDYSSKNQSNASSDDTNSNSAAPTSKYDGGVGISNAPMDFVLTDSDYSQMQSALDAAKGSGFATISKTGWQNTKYSSIKPYQVAAVSIPDAVALFYRVDGSSAWQYFAIGQAAPTCDSYKTPDEQKAFADSDCYASYPADPSEAQTVGNYYKLF
ncbi:MAG: hypothetical protein LBM73_01615 [Candidatus Nomurabacteria bacterium]|jgi:cytoskeletal protein RodZ|nr:hypothetical protein [Candidatus Nomurabacteria bacterium]